MRYEILKTEEFLDWYFKQNEKTKSVIEARLHRIQLEGHFGFINQFEGLIELKWTSGMRIYTFIYQGALVVALHGGNKNGQGKDIKKAKRIKNRYTLST